MATILVIDDEPGIRSTVRDILEDEGHRVLLAEDAVLGLELMTAERPDLAILSSHGRRGLDALLEGSFAQRIVAKLVCPLLLLRAE